MSRKYILIAILLSAIGAGASVYSIMHHYDVKAHGKTDAACNISDALNCDAVVLSEFSEPFGMGIPVGYFGLAFFLCLLFLAIFEKNRMASGGSYKDEKQLYSLGFLMTFVASLACIGLFYIAKVKINVLCPTCLVVYGVTLSLFVLYLLRMKTGFLFDKKFFSYLGNAVLAVVLVSQSHHVLKGFFIKSSITGNQTGHSDQDISNATQAESKTYDLQISYSPYQGDGEDYRKGSDDAPLVLVEFADFQCPACGSTASELHAAYQARPDKIQVIFKNYPLDNSCNSQVGGPIHPLACETAFFARCAGEYGKFWEFHDLVFANQPKISKSNLESWMKQLGVSDDQMKVCRNTPAHLDKIKSDISLGNQVRVQSTPTVFVNGKKYNGARSRDIFIKMADEL